MKLSIKLTSVISVLPGLVWFGGKRESLIYLRKGSGLNHDDAGKDLIFNRVLKSGSVIGLVNSIPFKDLSYSESLTKLIRVVRVT